MLLVIFGAGASYDSLPFYSASSGVYFKERPPLADQLFENRENFGKAMAIFPMVQPIVPYLEKRQGRPLEQILQELAEEASFYPKRYEHLMAIRYYIQYVLRDSEREWLTNIGRNVTNYKTLLDQVDRWIPREEPVCFVTFNYDRLFEDALGSLGVQLGSIESYITHPRFKLFKLHGSIDWVRDSGIHASQVGEVNQWGAVEAVLRWAGKLKIGDKIWIMKEELPTGRWKDTLVVPAIAIPLERKTSFECPADHVELLKKLLLQVDRILMIGWRATEYEFVQLLANNVRNPLVASNVRNPRLYVCAKDSTEGGEIADRLVGRGVVGNYEVDKEGFTELVTSRRLDFFLGS